jgi:hypothetical protein
MAALWFGLLSLPQPLRAGARVLIPIVLEVALLVGFASLIQRWSRSEAWNDLHRLALIFGPLIVVMIAGTFFVTAGHRLDQIGAGIFGIITIILLAFFARRLQFRVRDAHLAS